MDNSRSPLDSLFFCATGATDRNWKALSGVGRIDPVAGGGAQYVTGGGGPGGGGGGGGAGPSMAASGGGCGAVDGGGGGKNAVFRSKSPTEYRVPKTFVRQHAYVERRKLPEQLLTSEAPG